MTALDMAAWRDQANLSIDDAEVEHAGTVSAPGGRAGRPLEWKQRGCGAEDGERVLFQFLADLTITRLADRS